MIWTDDRVAELKKLWDEGFSASQVGEKMGCTRNAVIGKINRLRGYDRAEHARVKERSAGERKKPIPNTHKLIIKPKPKKTFDPHRAFFKAKKPTTPKKSIDRPTYGEPVMLHLKMTDLNWNDCRYPVGEATGAAQLFCGAPALFGESWCGFHHNIVFEPPAPKVKRDLERSALRAAA